MNSKLFKLCLSAILALSFYACGGDDDTGGGGNGGGGNSDDGNNNIVKCSPGSIICSPDGRAELVCNAAGNGYDKGQSCDNGCVDNACSGSGGSGDNSSGCVDGSSSCNNNNVNVVDDEGETCDSSRDSGINDRRKHKILYQSHRQICYRRPSW